MTKLSLGSLPRPPAPWTDPRTGIATPEFYRFITGLFEATGAVVPPGAVLDFLGAVAPTGFLALDGGTHNVVDYPDLATALGAAPGAVTFTLPNTINRFAMGSATPSETGGSGTVTLTVQNLPLGESVVTPASNVTAGAAAGGIATPKTGQGVAFSIIPPYVTFMRIVKT